MNILTLDKYIITYSNCFKVDNRIFSFRKRELFDITNTPIHLKLKDNNNCKGYWINRKWYSLSKISRLIVNTPINADVSELQWYQQEQLNEVFNLN